jgi:hypothetical protein
MSLTDEQVLELRMEKPKELIGLVKEFGYGKDGITHPLEDFFSRQSWSNGKGSILDCS